MTIWFVVMSLGLFAILGVLIDSSRGYVAHTNMQDYIDDWVLAAANELDGQPDSIERANQVLESALITKTTGIDMREGNGFEIDKVYFLSGPPQSQGSMLRSSDFQHLVTTDPTAASHILVTAAEREVPWTLLNFINAANDISAGEANFEIRTWAAATLQNDSVCVEPLLAMCAPSNFDLTNMPPGSQIRLEKNRQGNFAEGEYGVVTDIADDKAGTCSGYSGMERLECLLAIDTHDTQCGDNTVSFRGDPQQSVTFAITGDDTITVMQDALNVNRGMNPRLGIFDPEVGAYASSDEVSIDTVHNTGKPFACDGSVADVSSEAQDYPVASCFSDNTCGSTSPPVSRDELEDYWSKAHGGSLPATDFKGEPFVTRYDVYLHEFATGLVDSESGGNEGPRADCHPTKDSADTMANRRLFEIAVVDCTGMSDVEQTNVAVEGYATVFLTEQVENVPAFVATFDDLVDIDGDVDTASEGMSGGDVVGTVAHDLRGGPSKYYDPYAAQGMRIYAVAQKRRNDGYNIPMLYDSQAGPGEDPDLQSVDKGNVLIISENARSNRPDDHARGGVLIFTFDEPTTVQSLVFFDGEERNNKIHLYEEEIDLADVLDWDSRNDFFDEVGQGDVRLDVPVIGDGKHRTFYIDPDEHPSSGIRALVYEMHGSGAIDEITFSNATTTPNRYDDIVVEFLDVIDASDSEWVTYPVITN